MSNNIIYLKDEKERVKNLFYLITGKHLLDEEAQEILNQYKNYLNRDYISLPLYIHILYIQKD